MKTTNLLFASFMYSAICLPLTVSASQSGRLDKRQKLTASEIVGHFDSTIKAHRGDALLMIVSRLIALEDDVIPSQRIEEAYLGILEQADSSPARLILALTLFGRYRSNSEDATRKERVMKVIENFSCQDLYKFIHLHFQRDLATCEKFFPRSLVMPSIPTGALDETERARILDVLVARDSNESQWLDGFVRLFGNIDDSFEDRDLSWLENLSERQLKTYLEKIRPVAPKSLARESLEFVINHTW